MFYGCVLFCLLLVTFSKISCELSESEIESLKSLPGHLKPFGSAGPYFEIPITEGFPKPHDFFNQFVVPSIPLVMKGGAKLSPAYEKWSDEYFLEHPGSTESVYTEPRKKEVRTEIGEDMPFRDYVKRYTSEEIYMVYKVPNFLRSDVFLPPPLKCDPVLKELALTVMWYSSGGTRSVLHHDGVENINCLFRGNKTLIFVSPFHTEEDWVANVLDIPSGSYSSADVDSVDFVKYPDLAKHKYAVVNMTQGDCLFIPYKWAHQVNSFGRNLAVNVWFNHKPAHLSNMTQARCGEHPGPISLADVEFNEKHFENVVGKAVGKAVFDKDHKPSEETEKTKSDQKKKNQNIFLVMFRQLRKKKFMDFDDIKAGLQNSIPESSLLWNEQCEKIARDFYNAIDQNEDGDVNKLDVDVIRGSGKKNILELIEKTDDIFAELHSALESARNQYKFELIKRLLSRGEIDKERGSNIYGDKFLQGGFPAAMFKQEL